MALTNSNPTLTQLPPPGYIDNGTRVIVPGLSCGAYIFARSCLPSLPALSAPATAGPSLLAFMLRAPFSLLSCLRCPYLPPARLPWLLPRSLWVQGLMWPSSTT